MKYLVIILTILAPGCLHAQGFIAGEATYSSFSMKELKDFQTQTARSISPELKTVTNFPSYFGWGLNGGYSFNENLVAGISFRYTSTGARSNIKDNSAEVTLDQLVQSWSGGPFVRYKIFNINKLEAYIGANAYYVRSSDDIISTVHYGTQTNTDNLHFKGSGIGFVPSLQINYPVIKGLFVYASAGYEAQMQKKLKYNDQETKLHAEWNGMRLALGIGYRYNKSSDK